MASHIFSFIVVRLVTSEEFENCRIASDGAAATASLPVTGAACKPPGKFSAAVGVVSKLKRKKNHWLSAPMIPLSTMPR